MRQFNVRGHAANRWLYDWADDKFGDHGPQSIPVWTHDRGKALVLDAMDAAFAVAKAQKAGVFAASRVDTNSDRSY